MSTVERKKRVVFLSGTRADFGKIKSLITALSASEHFEVHTFVTGMHMERKYGYTVTEIEKSGITNVYRYINQAGHGFMDRSLANTVVGFGDYVRLINPDLIVVHGDRVEALAGALVGSLNNMLVAHVEGGEVSGTVDDLIRHSVSKMSHLHFVSNQDAKRRLIQLGEEPKSISVIGSPDLDIMLSPNLPSLKSVKNHYEINFNHYNILVYHPVTTSLNVVRKECRALMKAVIQSEKNYVVIYPNNDHGCGIILEEYEQHIANHPRFRLFPSVRFEAMLVLLQNADCIVGNSSMGIHEAPFYGIPTVNVGTRQEGRSKNNRIVHVAGNDKAVLQAIQNAMELKERLQPVHEFGAGDSHARFLQVLENPQLWSTHVQKRFRDVEFTSEERSKRNTSDPARAKWLQRHPEEKSRVTLRAPAPVLDTRRRTEGS